jgi:hypothetical protein
MRILFSILLLSAFALRAQYYDDAQIRTHLLVEKKFGKHFSASVEQQNRFTHNATTLSRASADIGLNWKFNKYIKVSADYIFIEKRNNDNTYSPRNWANVALHLRKEWKRWKFFYRGMLQLRSGDLFTNDFYELRLYNREKINIRYEVTKRIGLFVADEIYIPLNSPQASGIDRNRAYLGSTYKLSKNQQLEFYFMYQQQLQKNYWYDQRNRYDNTMLRRYFIYGIGYAISIQ